ncbi:MAG: MarR family transcriptional regulator [Bacteroidota bacterium]
MAYVVKEIIRNLSKRFAAKGVNLTIEQYFILNILDNEDGLILQDLAEIVDRDKSAVLRHIDSLEEKHFVTRVTDRKDKRRKLLLVTKPGMIELEKAREIDQEIDQELMQESENIEIKDFQKTLSNMYNYLISDNS